MPPGKQAAMASCELKINRKPELRIRPRDPLPVQHEAVLGIPMFDLHAPRTCLAIRFVPPGPLYSGSKRANLDRIST